DRTFSNIMVTIPGRKFPQEVVLVGAHYDTVAGTPGADDNASAVAALLELCRILKNDEPERSIKFVFFTLEEPPIFRSPYQGSVVYARAARARGENIVAMICLEMLGYYSDTKGGQGFPIPLMAALYSTTPNFIAVVGNFASRHLVGTVARSLRSAGTVAVETLTAFGLIPGVDLSDHRSFWDEGYPAVMITDTAFYRNPNYHTEGDTIATLDFSYLSALLEALVKMTRDLAHGG
ncbi:MAG: M20/M25/M40 family metallo-hydrolase, partial [Syntrophales bacterium]|nr:M20/M25/M40 family metallo-hydrolase [Syntrophales bacterium]